MKKKELGTKLLVASIVSPVAGVLLYQLYALLIRIFVDDVVLPFFPYGVIRILLYVLIYSWVILFPTGLLVMLLTPSKELKK